jgi:hypothetical protein
MAEQFCMAFSRLGRSAICQDGEYAELTSHAVDSSPGPVLDGLQSVVGAG